MIPKYITVHCTATPPSVNCGVKEVDAMHRARGWSECGYHVIIRRSGEIEYGRSITKKGAGVLYYNDDNIQVSLEGGVDENNNPEFNYTEAQMCALRYKIAVFIGTYGIIQENIKGHRDWPNVKKACPCFDVQAKLKEWYNDVQT